MSLAQVDWRPPELRTERLLLRGYERADAGAIHAYAADPQVAEFMSWTAIRAPRRPRCF
jgi:RimJ/RimL family protein N-acetyltransferase